MPPQQTNFTSETACGATGLSLDLTIPLVKDNPDNALAEEFSDASITALRDPSSEKEAAGPPVAPTRSVLSVLQEYWRAFRKRRQVESLHNLSDRELADIGLTRSDVDRLVLRGAIERLGDNATYLWLTRGI